MKQKVSILNDSKFCEVGQVEECLGQVAHEVSLAVEQFEIFNFFLVLL